MKIQSPAFADNQPMPKEYACEGKNVNPPLDFYEIPTGAQSLALITEDIDATNERSSFLHWIVWNIPADVSHLDENAVVGTMAIVGFNDGNRDYYEGPCPPDGQHRYVFRLYALNEFLDIPKDAKMPGLEKAMQGHILAQTTMTGTYQKESSAANNSDAPSASAQPAPGN